MTGKARFEQTAGNKPPILSPGDLSPEELRKWETGCCQYFKVKMIAADNQVSHVTWNLQDPRIQDWYATEADRLNTLAFNDFMKDVRKTWLPLDWDTTIRQKMLASSQHARPFREWTVEVQSLNTILHNMLSHLNNAALRFHLEARMHPDLQKKCRLVTLPLADDLRTWLEKVSLLNKERENDARRQRQLFDAMLRDSRSQPRSTHATQPPSRFTTRTTSSLARLAALTPDERCLLMDNDG